MCVCVCVCVSPAHLLGCGKCVSSCVLYSSVGGVTRERKRGAEQSRDAVFFSVALLLLHHLCFSSQSACTRQVCAVNNLHLQCSTDTHTHTHTRTHAVSSLHLHHLLTWLPSSGSRARCGAGMIKRPRLQTRLTAAESQSESSRAASWSPVTR